jgi:excisionase family DNA binding protein
MVEVTRQREVKLGMDNLISVEQAAQRLGVSFWTVYRLARSGRLASIRLGRRRLFQEQDLERLISATRQEGKPSPVRENTTDAR